MTSDEIEILAAAITRSYEDLSAAITRSHDDLSRLGVGVEANLQRVEARMTETLAA